MKWTRQAPGSYVTFSKTKMTKEGSVKEVPVRVEVVRAEGWDPKGEQWYLNIVALFPERQFANEQILVDGARGDSIHFTLREAKQSAEADVGHGFIFYRSGGFSAWVPDTGNK